MIMDEKKYKTGTRNVNILSGTRTHTFEEGKNQIKTNSSCIKMK